MYRFLSFRPSTRGQLFWLHRLKLGDAIYHYPCIEFKAICRDQWRQLHLTQLPEYIVLTSPTAVRILMRYLSVNELKSRHLLAVGKTTESTISDYGLKAHSPQQGQGLTVLLDEYKSFFSNQWLIVGGPISQVSRNALDRIKLHQGYAVYCKIYDRLESTNLKAPGLRFFLSGGVDVVIVFCETSLKHFQQVVKSYSDYNWDNVHLLVNSNRLESIARALITKRMLISVIEPYDSAIESWLNKC